MNSETLGKVIANAKSEALRAALPAEPPGWFGAWWDNGWELSDETEVLSAWRALRAHLLGEDA